LFQLFIDSFLELSAIDPDERKMDMSGFDYDDRMIVSLQGQQAGDEANCMTMESAKLHGRDRRHLEDLKKQIAQCLDRELNLLAEERRERARHLGLDGLPVESPRKLSA